MNEQDLLKLKARIDRAKTEVAELKGRESYLLKELKEKYSCNNIEEAQEKLSTMEDEISQLQEQYDASITELQEKYDL